MFWTCSTVAPSFLNSLSRRSMTSFAPSSLPFTLRTRSPSYRFLLLIYRGWFSGLFLFLILLLISLRAAPERVRLGLRLRGSSCKHSSRPRGRGCGRCRWLPTRGRDSAPRRAVPPRQNCPGHGRLPRSRRSRRGAGSPVRYRKACGHALQVLATSSRRPCQERRRPSREQRRPQEHLLLSSP